MGPPTSGPPVCPSSPKRRHMSIPASGPPLASAGSRSHPSPPRPALFFPPRQAPGGSLPCTPQLPSPAPRARCRGRSDRLGDPGTVSLSHGPAPAAEPGARRQAALVPPSTPIPLMDIEAPRGLHRPCWEVVVFAGEQRSLRPGMVGARGPDTGTWARMGARSEQEQPGVYF